MGKNYSLDTQLTQALIDEGEYRDFIRNVQVLRKEQNLKLTQPIKIFAPNWPKAFESEILTKTIATSIEKSDTLRVETVNNE